MEDPKVPNQLVMEIGKKKESFPIFNYLFNLLSTKLCTTVGSAKVEVSPKLL